MSDLGFGLYSKRVYTADGIKEAVVVINDGKITDIIAPELAHPDCPIEDLHELCLLPGLIDSHVHVNEPGRTEWEGFRTATRAAAAGGITTIADMPLNCDPVTTSAEALQIKLDALKGILPASEKSAAKTNQKKMPKSKDAKSTGAQEAETKEEVTDLEEKLFVDCAFYGGVVPGNAGELEKMIEMGVAGFKCFLIHSGIDEFPNVNEADLKEAMPILARHKIPLLVHAELDCGACSEAAEDKWKDPRSYKSFLESRPAKWENDAIEMMIRLCREYKGPVHIVHLSSAEALPAISVLKKDRLPFTVETCPHYLSFEAEKIPDGDPRFKCAPPIREGENKEKLWRGLTAGLIDFIVSDHSPCVPDKKFLSEGDLKRAWGGISSLQFGLPVIWTEAKKRGIELFELIEWMSARPAKFLGLANRKGAIRVGYDADLIAFDPDADFRIVKDLIQHKHKVTPYEGKQLKGLVRKTYVRGRLVYEDGRVTAHASGEQILHTQAGIKS